MAEYVTKYPKTISFLDVICGSLKGIVKISNISSVEQLHVVVKKNADELLNCGINLLTGGNHSWDKKKDMLTLLETKPVLRPDN